MTERTFGRLPAQDGRDYQLVRLMAAAPPLELPAYRYWQPGKALDQGLTPECVAYAWEGFLHADPIRTYSGPTPDSIYHAAQLVDEFDGEDYEGTSVRAGAKVLAAQGRLASYAFAWNAQVVRDWVLSKGPLVFGTDWLAGMETPNAKGYVAATGAVLGGHAYLCYGYSLARNAFRCLNSWGASWGDQGAFWLGMPDFDFLLKRGGEACTAVESKPA